MYNCQLSQKGFSFVEAVIVAALSAVVFGALFSSFQYSLNLINHSRAKLSAISVANDRMEYFRSLPYNDVGTISGIPPGTIPQNSTTTLNEIEFIERVLVEYVDDPSDGEDGTATPDSNGIPSDYKRLKLEYTWEIGGATNSISLISNIVPRSVETTAGGGTARINVIDSEAALLPGASVQLVNKTTTSTIDVTRFTDANGAALFSGAPAASNYEVIVTANISGKDYSTAQTYEATTTNPNPVVSPFAVLESDVSTLTFQIGELSDLDIFTRSAITEGTFLEDFSSLLAVASSSKVETVAGELVLENTLGTYETSGVAYLGPIEPVPFLRWQTLRTAATLPVNTSHRVQFFTSTTTGQYTLVTDSELPGNVAGFTGTIVDLSKLDPGLYPSVYVGVTLETTDTSVTSAIDQISVYYRQSVTELPSITFDIRGEKIIGTDVVASPIYKYTDTLITDGTGEISVTDLEFDAYTITAPGGYDIAVGCPAHPFVQQAGVNGELELVLVGNAANTLNVLVVDGIGSSIPGASVNLTRPGYDVTIPTNNCGQTFFTGGVSDNTDYSIDVTASGYVSESVSLFEISGDSSTVITLTE
ncbi:MAG: type II secretory pathway pseudopilin PulG [Candidatus Paceibacteria bacterium]|jgi:type II secretory pathway pseudopilin PulG